MQELDLRTISFEFNSYLENKDGLGLVKYRQDIGPFIGQGHAFARRHGGFE